MNIPALIAESHAIALEKGWWEKPEDNDPDTKIANMHAEVSEAFEEVRAGHPLDEVYYSHELDAMGNAFCLACSCVYDPRLDACPACGHFAKPEGFTVELADLLIWLADTCGQWGWKIGEMYDADYENWTVAAFVNDLHDILRDLRKADDVDRPGEAAWIFHYAYNFARIHNLPLERALTEKMAFNRTRPHRHGKVI